MTHSICSIAGLFLAAAFAVWMIFPPPGKGELLEIREAGARSFRMWTDNYTGMRDFLAPGKRCFYNCIEDFRIKMDGTGEAGLNITGSHPGKLKIINNERFRKKPE